MNRLHSLFGVALAVAVLSPALGEGGFIPYPTPGTVNPVTYTFVATSSTVTVYYYGKSASDTDEIGLVDVTNNTSRGYFLPNNATAQGASHTFTNVAIGDTLVFALLNENLTTSTGTNQVAYSNPASNGPFDFGTPGAGVNHIYATPYTADGIIPFNGTFIGFEDLPANGSGGTPDYDYNDYEFVVTGAAPTPEPATITLLGIGISGLAGYSWRRRK